MSNFCCLPGRGGDFPFLVSSGSLTAKAVDLALDSVDLVKHNGARRISQETFTRTGGSLVGFGPVKHNNNHRGYESGSITSFEQQGWSSSL